MLASEVIERLNSLIREHGDLETGYWNYQEYDFISDIIINNEEDVDSERFKVFNNNTKKFETCKKFFKII